MKHFSISLPIDYICSFDYLISFFFSPAPLKFLIDTIFFCSDSNFGIFNFISFLFSSSRVASETTPDFLNYNSFISSFSFLCFDSNSLNSFVYFKKLFNFTFLSSSFSSNLLLFYYILVDRLANFFAYLVSFYSSTSIFLTLTSILVCICWRCFMSSPFSFSIFRSFYFLYSNFKPSSLKLSLTSLIYFTILLSSLFLIFSSYFFFFSNLSNSYI